MKNFYKNLFLIISIFISISLFFSFFMTKNNEIIDLSLNQLAQKINNNEVKKIIISGSQLNILLNDDKKAIAQKENESGIIETLKNLGTKEDALQKVDIVVQNESGLRFWAGVLIPTILPLLLIMLFFWFTFRQAKSGINQAFTFGRSNIRLFSPKFHERITFKDVAGLKEAKEELTEIVDFLKSPKKYLDIGARIPRGVLLVGHPGTGKTLLAKAVAGESNVPFFHVSASEFVEMFVGVGAARIRDAFQTAKSAAPSILFIDEIDAVGRQRGAGLGGGNDEREQTLNQILVELDGFDRNTQLIVLAATNRPDVLDPALLRPGRFDRRIILDLPDINDREEILKIHARNKQLEPDVDLKKVAVRTPGFSGADLANLINEAAILAARKNKTKISQNELFEAIEKVILGPERKNKSISQKEKEITAYHEGGHALVAAAIKESDPVHKVSIISRGFAGGYTMKLPIEERRLKTRKQFLADLAMMLGGYAAEKIVFEDISTGASNDLKEATDLTRKLVTRYGMSNLGPITFGETEELIFLGREIATEKNYSEETAKKIDEEVKRIIDHVYNLTISIIKKNKKILDKIAQVLMEKETLEQEEFYELLKPFKLKQVSINF
ncbi:MAG: ATP-dependent zinc metalloprotease FtsH [Patescibacteria group bacterium]|nr:ATP-dependent zinc metalloprotease FtsH [Patescibacteria group bacterium]MCX7589677.1 ATP-dependent zinc metalloprotease FtsH [Patescibacteria group bacterium]MDW8279803.1 ATP-dependent zinc metalloprotease FtsH [bacterium]